MVLTCNILIGVSICIFIYNIWVYKRNYEFINRDEMGSSLTFNFGYVLAIIPLFVSLLLYPNLKWWWSVVALSTILYMPFFLKPIIHNILHFFRLVDKKS